MEEQNTSAADARLQYLNEVLRTFRLISREADVNRMLEKACQMLTNTHGYVYAWIYLTGGRENMIQMFHSGSAALFRRLEEKVQAGETVHCITEAMKKQEIIVIGSHLDFCRECPLFDYLSAGQGLIVRLACKGRVFGTMTVYSDRQMAANPVEQEFISDVAGDIAYALYNIEQAEIRKNERAALLASEDRYRQLFENSASGVAVYEAVEKGGNFIFKDFNKKAEKIEQRDRADVIGRRITDAFPGVEAFGLFELLQRVWATGNPEYMSEALYLDDKDPGTWRENWVYRLPGGEVIAVYNDITARKKAEAALMDSATRNQAIFSNFPDAIFIADTENRPDCGCKPCGFKSVKNACRKNYRPSSVTTSSTGKADRSKSNFSAASGGCGKKSSVSVK
jgi:PAS domain S-box-containing protein